jgi:hypothetical protein
VSLVAVPTSAVLGPGGHDLDGGYRGRRVTLAPATSGPTSVMPFALREGTRYNTSGLGALPFGRF